MAEPEDLKTAPKLSPATESHAALARKYRPKTFAELIGQEAMVRTLRNAFASGRVAQAYMLTGVRGVGKTTTARLIARALNYEAPGADGPTLDMEGEGIHCRAILESRHLDVLEMDAASHTGIDDVRELIDSAHYKPNTARYKVYIIDEVHMLSKQAFNGLLKTLEEPPGHVKFIFATTEARKVPVTVLSRCQRFDLRRIEIEPLTAHLASVVEQEGAAAERPALALIARAAEGSVRDALSILDRAIAFGSGRVEADAVRGLLGLADRGRVFDLLETVLRGDAGGALTLFSALTADGAEPGQAVADLADAVHAVTLAKAAGTADPAASEAERARAADLAARLKMPVLARAWQMLLKGYDEVRSSPRPQAAADMVLVRLAYAADLPTPGELARASRDGDAAPAPRPERAAPQPSPAPRKPAPAESSVKAMPSAEAAQLQPDPAEDVSLQSFDDVVALAEAKRDLKLRNALLEQVRLVDFEPGAIQLKLLPNAPRDLTQDLRKKLAGWTGRLWSVDSSESEGKPPLGQQRREKEKREIDAVSEHPAVREVLEHFPDAKIVAVRPAPREDAETDEGLAPEDVEAFPEDGTNR
ncbi:MAG TPA: DNA polymerase III subunit gamma/tau [Methyloceanibacter sp.]|nr:DNA polymerase III subunit gamma/tau [Methyloceanibacter sp.]